MMLNWISEAEKLPIIAQHVLLAVPRQVGEFWDLKMAQLLVAHEDVVPLPVAKGSRWPSQWYWDSSRGGDRYVTLVTGNAWWALLNEINLPPGAEHRSERGYYYIAQPLPVFVTQGLRW
jgi:hypothetical protein